jgi:hypothetical protein
VRFDGSVEALGQAGLRQERLAPVLRGEQEVRGLDDAREAIERLPGGLDGAQPNACGGAEPIEVAESCAQLIDEPVLVTNWCLRGARRPVDGERRSSDSKTLA